MSNLEITSDDTLEKAVLDIGTMVREHASGQEDFSDI